MRKIITSNVYGVQALVDLTLELEVDEAVWDEMTTAEQRECLLKFGRRNVKYVQTKIHGIDKIHETYL